jgi:hypothetical protein
MPWAAAGAVVGALISADSQRSAANKAAGATEDSNELEKYMYDQTRQDNLPALQSRNSGLTQLQQLLGIGGDPKAANYGSLMDRYTGQDLQNDPGYQFGLKQGTSALEQSAAARGGLYSGATMKALQRYGQDYGGTKFNEGFNRNQAQNDAIFGRFASLAGLGQAGSSQLATAGQNYANSVGNNMIGLANVQAAQGINQGNQLSNGVNQLAAWASNRNSGRGFGSGYNGSNDQPWYNNQSSTDWWMSGGSSGD